MLGISRQALLRQFSGNKFKGSRTISMANCIFAKPSVFPSHFPFWEPPKAIVSKETGPFAQHLVSSIFVEPPFRRSLRTPSCKHYEGRCDLSHAHAPQVGFESFARTSTFSGGSTCDRCERGDGNENEMQGSKKSHPTVLFLLFFPGIPKTGSFHSTFPTYRTNVWTAHPPPPSPLDHARVRRKLKLLQKQM